MRARTATSSMQKRPSGGYVCETKTYMKKAQTKKCARKPCRICGKTRILGSYGKCEVCIKALSPLKDRKERRRVKKLLKTAAIVCRAKKCPNRPGRGYDGYCNDCFRQRFPLCKTRVLRRRSKTKKCEKKAQTGYNGYCKACFRQCFPAVYAQKRNKRLKACRFCGQIGNLRKRGICQVCTTARKCSRCDEITFRSSAPNCGLCHLLRRPERMAVWCSSCFTSEERSAGLCSMCLRCDHCKSKACMTKGHLRCSEASCARSFLLCDTCWSYWQDSKEYQCDSSKTLLFEEFQCKACWYRAGHRCISCKARKGRTELNKLRHCSPCLRKNARVVRKEAVEKAMMDVKRMLYAADSLWL